MAKIFLDTNTFIDLMVPRNDSTLDQFTGNQLFISPLSIHIYLYSYKEKVPTKKLTNLKESLSIVPLTKEVSDRALEGPTAAFEDNVQLHSASESECDLFLTSDQKLLKTGIFGKTKIIPISGLADL